MKRAILLLTLAFAALQSACTGGGGGIPPIPPPVGGFSNADLKGQYAFTMAGEGPNGFFARIGVFVADGNGHITGGIEDVDVGAGDETLTFGNSTYTINADGRGFINLVNATTGNNPLIFSVTLVSPNQGYLAETDNISTTSGSFTLQNTSAFTPASLSANYVFDFSGLVPDLNTNPVVFLGDSIVGQFQFNNGAMQGGVLDENAGGTPSGPLAIAAANGLSFDATNGPTFGRGTLTFLAGGSQFNYVFYVVDSTRIHLMEMNATGLTVGDAIRQTAAPANNAGLNGSFAYLMAGGSSAGPDTRVGRFTTNGTGGLTGIAQDENDNGSIFSVPNGTLSATSYFVDAGFPGSGRVEITFTDSKISPTTFLIAYMASGSQGVLQDVSNGFVLDGQILAQTGGPFTPASQTGNYAFNYSGIGFNTTTGLIAEEDFVGQMKITNAASANVTGAMDFSAFSSNQGIFLDVGVSGTLTLGGDGTTSTGTRNTLPLKTANSPSTTYPFQTYIVNPSTMFILSTHQDHVVAGVIVRQSK